MKSIFKNYKFSIILLFSIIIGGIMGITLGPKVIVVKPLGDLFLNLMFMIIVPMVFFSVSSAIANMSNVKRLGKIMRNVFLVFAFTALLSSILALVACLFVSPTKGIDYKAIESVISKGAESLEKTKKLGVLEHITNTLTVGDFSELLSKKSMLQLIVFSILLGTSTTLIGDKGEPFKKFLYSGSEVMMKMVGIIMYYAPIGLGCYFANVIGELGPQILQGFLRSFILYVVLTVIYYFAFFTLYAFLAGGKNGIRVFWKNALMPSVTALATCSSAASIPVNLKATKDMGVVDDIAETVIPLGANIHKDGSVIGGVLKIIFLFGIFGRDIKGFSTILSIIVVSFLVGAVMGAIPGGGVMGEMLIISVYGFPPEALPMIVIIGTIIDAPATLLNSTGNTVCAMLVQRIVEGKSVEKINI
ncbi:dicarboxylate/amino acid:cation symporter [Hathewaya massiliensis]|uniref:dicarboxylate/amino acid:cation symporter n=1 Tax=Hathewaya massiliensis TaxID=1964382 RepID=UPI00115B6215|nr:dicarboxylate/amino acid:cation symporter [Hathewaya massiliensis]